MKDNSKKFLSVISILILCFVMTFAGCQGKPPSPDGGDVDGGNQNDFPETPNTTSVSFDISYYNISNIKNCAEGILLINKNGNFNEEITTLQVKWGDKDSSFDDYSALNSFTNLRGSEFEYDFIANSLIPTKATKIWVEAINSNGEIIDKGCVGVEKFKKKNKLNYEFQVISDQQVSTSSAFYRRSKNTFADILQNSPSSALIAVNGDVVDEANASYYDSFYKSYNDVYGNLTSATKLLVGLGNHEFIIQSENGNYAGLTQAELKDRYNQRLSLWKEKTKNTSPYFYYEINGSYFIFLGTTAMPKALDGNTRADCTLGTEQLSWLQNLLTEAGKTKKPIYLFSHGSLRDTVSGSLSALNQTWYGYSLQEENLLRNIIKDYPQIMFFSSHSHWSFESESPFVINQNYPSFFNTAAIGYLWEGVGGGNHYENGTYENGGAQGLYLEVYEDQLFIKGRQFEASDGVSKYWYSGYQVVLPI